MEVRKYCASDQMCRCECECGYKCEVANVGARMGLWVWAWVCEGEWQGRMRADKCANVNDWDCVRKCEYECECVSGIFQCGSVNARMNASGNVRWEYEYACKWVSAANVKQMFEWAYESVSVNKSINESVDANAFVSCEWGGVRMIVCECEYTSVWMWHACIYTNTTQNHTCMLWINRTNRSKQIQGKNNKQTHTHWLDQDHSSLTQSMYSLTHTNALTRCQSCQGNKVNCERTQCQMPNVKC